MHPLRFAALLVALAMPALAHAQVTISEAWVRGTVAGQRATGAFMKLVANDDVALVSAASPAAASVEIHEMKTEGGMMSMRQIERLPLAKGRTIVLSPGGHHLMLMGLAKSVAAGDKIPLALTFEDRNGKRVTIDVTATARPLTESAAAHKH